MFGILIEVVNADNQDRSVWVWTRKAPEPWRDRGVALYRLARTIGGPHPIGFQA